MSGLRFFRNAGRTVTSHRDDNMGHLHGSGSTRLGYTAEYFCIITILKI